MSFHRKESSSLLIKAAKEQVNKSDVDNSRVDKKLGIFAAK